MAKAAPKTTPEQTASYSKQQLAASKRYANRQDIISVLLLDGETYTFDEVDQLMENYMKGKVN